MNSQTFYAQRGLRCIGRVRGERRPQLCAPVASELADEFMYPPPPKPRFVAATSLVPSDGDATVAPTAWHEVDCLS